MAPTTSDNAPINGIARWQVIAADAAKHHGLVERRASRLGKGAWYHAIRSARLESLHPGVARIVGSEKTLDQRIAAAVMAAGDGAMASHRSAAHLHGMPITPVPRRTGSHAVDDIDDVDTVHVTIPTRRRRPSLAGVMIHRPCDLGHLNPHRINGIRCTNVVRTLCDLGAVDTSAVHGAVGHALAQGGVDLGALESIVEQHAKRGRPGISALRDAIDSWSIDRKPADSVLEPAMHRLVARYSLPPVEFHPSIEGYEPDFRVIGSCVLLECDGWAYHGLDHARFERDRDRDAQLIAAGWIIVRFTYRAVTSSPARTAQRIRAALDRWNGVTPPDGHC